MKTTSPDVIVSYIKTKNKLRKIVSYSSESSPLRLYHQRINSFLEERFVPSIFSKGYVKGQSIFNNAQAHMYNDYFIMLDIKDFFQNICHKQLIDKLFYEINLLEARQISKKECRELLKSCSISTRGIPLGFITSPILSNIYLKEFDGIFYGKLKQLGLSNIIYTRYADDLTVSFQTDNTSKQPEIEKAVAAIAESILSRYGLHINKQKTRSYSLHISNHIRITGVNITKDSAKRKLTVGRTVKNELYWNAIKCLECKDEKLIQQVKGMQSFILSVEKNGYEHCYSPVMINKIQALGFNSLRSLIDSL